MEVHMAYMFMSRWYLYTTFFYLQNHHCPPFLFISVKFCLLRRCFPIPPAEVWRPWLVFFFLLSFAAHPKFTWIVWWDSLSLWTEGKRRKCMPGREKGRPRSYGCVPFINSLLLLFTCTELEDVKWLYKIEKNYSDPPFQQKWKICIRKLLFVFHFNILYYIRPF